MTTETHALFYAKCDGCGTDVFDIDLTLWGSDGDEAITEACEALGWTASEEGRTLCRACQPPDESGEE